MLDLIAATDDLGGQIRKIAETTVDVDEAQALERLATKLESAAEEATAVVGRFENE